MSIANHYSNPVSTHGSQTRGLPKSIRQQSNVKLVGGDAFAKQNAMTRHNIQDRGHHYSSPVHRGRATGHHTQAGSVSHNQCAHPSDVHSFHAHRMSSMTAPNTDQPVILARSSILGERTEYTERRVPRRVLHEKKVRKHVMVPTTVTDETHADEVIEIKEKIIEVASNKEPETKIVYNEIVKHRPVKKKEYITEKVPRMSYKERVVEVPEVEYVDVPYERIVEVPEEKITYKEVKVPQYVDVYVPHQVDVEQQVDAHRRIPVPVEAITNYTFELPTLKPQYKRKELPIYAPRFVEVPVPAELMDAESQQLAIHLREQIHLLAAQDAPSLVEVEKIARFAKEVDFQSHISCTDYQKAIETAWRNKQLTVQNGMLQSVGQNTPSIPTFGNRV